MVAGEPAHEAPPDNTARIHDRDPALQEGMSLRTGLPESMTQRADGRGQRPGRPGGPDSPAGPEQRIGHSRRVGQDLTVRHERFFEVPRKGGISVADEDEPRPGRFDLVLDAAQLRRLLFAEQSAVMTEPDKDHGPLLEDRAQEHLVSVEVEHHALREFAVAGCQHRLCTNRL